MTNEMKIEEYKSLILKREKLRKDAQLYWIAYIKEFGDLIERSHTLQIECVKAKKLIAFCQAKQNRGLLVFRTELDSYLESVMNHYYEELEYIVQVRDAKSEQITEVDYYKLKKIYRKLATLLHPDLHPALFEHEEICELWEKLRAAYMCNDFMEMQSLEVLVFEALKKYENAECELHVENIDAKISWIRNEIEEIRTTDPYRYNDLLINEEAVAEKKRDLQFEIHEYSDYLAELQEEANQFAIKESVQWES